MFIFYAAFTGAMLSRTRLLLAFLLLLSAPCVLAQERSQLIPLSVEERVRHSDVIVEGEVVSQQSFWDAHHENIYTSNIINVYKVFKGQVQAQQLEVITQGGTVGLKMHVFSAALKLSKGEQGIFFLEKEQELHNTPAAGKNLTVKAYGNQQGFVQYDVARNQATDVFNAYASVQDVYSAVTTHTGAGYRTVATNERLRQAQQNQTERREAQQSPLAPVITSFTPKVSTAGTNAILTIKGDNFGSRRGDGFVEFRNADDGGQTFVKPLDKAYLSWSDTQIRLLIPSAGVEEGTAGSGEIRVTTNSGSSSISDDELVLEFAYSNINFEGRAFQPILIDKDNDGGYTIQFAPSMQNNNAAQEGFRRAMNSWVCTTTVNWKIGGTTTIEKAAEDDLNIIRFIPGSEIGAGVLASTVSRYEGCGTDTDTLFWVKEFDMDINSNITWQYGPGGPVNRQYDFQTVMLHELGHAHQLGHVILPRGSTTPRVMNYAVEFESLVRDLSAADIAGGNLVMVRSLAPNVCGEQPMEAKLDGDCNIAPEIYTFEALFENGQVVTNWTTNNEQDISSFVVQRSPDGLTWEDVPGQISAKGPESGFLEYSAVDPEPLPRISYYRLRVVYEDGSESFSPRYRVINPADLRRLTVFPNPVNPEDDFAMLEYIVQGSTTVTVQLYSMTGTLVREENINFTDVNLPVKLDLTGLASGLYILQWQEKGKTGSVKVLKL
ncbi:T9SS type A sorting domain-containing protein [Pontibacter sp. 172403-2]|uniref:IPT/TIG domain-containing protein n=1 Tax=Pontibacter rufus TaxID=2791028 RepID=UPI0018B01255|nr:IPT/TIG domain-containing protein [Pontibacter sp. 172403-2]MBF9252969.1 T9SS type A sorting domain-containing protein [Pontibacter sp. 172403-2]